MAFTVMLGIMPMTNVCAQGEVQGFVHEQSSEDGYEWPTDPQVLNKPLRMDSQLASQSARIFYFCLLQQKA